MAGQAMKIRMLGAIGAMLVLASPAHAFSVRAGVEAWQKGDHAAAIAIWGPLAAKGDADAAFNLGQAYRLGKGTPIDLKRAQTLLEQAARQGHVDAATTLGILLFQNGDRTAAMRWLRTAAEAGEPRAMLIYGTALYNGDGVAADPVTAYAFISRAAAQGLEPAKATLADLDATLPIEQRRKGVAAAQAMVSPKQVAAPGTARISTTRSTPAKPKPATPATVAASGNWRIQLGAFGQRSSAEGLFAKLGGKLAGRQAYYVPTGKVVRLQVGPYESRAAATAACARLGQSCFAVEAR